MLTRRAFLNASALLALASETSAGAAPAIGSAALQATPKGGALTWAELPLEQGSGPARRALVIYPATPADRTYPGLVLFHGRGETNAAELGLHAWRTRYGLERNHARLRQLPLQLDEDERRYIEPERLGALDATLRADPFEGLVYICPLTPDPHRARSPEALLDGYADWIERVLLPAARAHAPLAARALGLDGCSLGGFVAAETFVRKPHLFQSFGVVQPAFGAYRAQRYAAALAAATQRGSLRAIHLETSTRDPFRRSVQALGNELSKRSVGFDLEQLPGPHDQPWLRASGTLAMLAWHERILSAGEAGATSTTLARDCAR